MKNVCPSIIPLVLTIACGACIGRAAAGQEDTVFRLRVEGGAPVILSAPESLEMVTGWKYPCTVEIENTENVRYDLSLSVVGRTRIIVADNRIMLQANQQEAMPFLLQTLSPYDHEVKIVVTCGRQEVSIPVRIIVRLDRNRVTFGVLDHFVREGPIAELQERPDDWVPTMKDGKGKKPPPKQDGGRRKPPLKQSGKRRKPPLTQDGKRRKPPLQQGGRPAKKFVKDQNAKRADVPADGWKGSPEWARSMTTAPGRELGDRVLADMRIMQDLGCQIYRTDIFWALVEHLQGEFQWDRTDWIIDALRSPEGGGCRLIGQIGYQPAWLSPEFHKEKSGREAYERWVEAVVSRYATKVDYWEIWNEPMLFWMRSPKGRKGSSQEDFERLAQSYADMFLAVVRSASTIIRERYPDAIILSPGFVNVFQLPDPFLKIVATKLLAGGLAEYVDAYCNHNYPVGFSRPVPSLRDNRAWRKFDQAADSSELIRFIAEYDSKLPLYCTEFGGFKLPPIASPTEEAAAAIALLRNGCIMAHQGFLGLIYTELYDYEGSATTYLVRHQDKHKTRGYLAYQKLIAALAGAKAYVVPQIPRSKILDCDYSGLVVKGFRRGSEDILCIWNNDTRQRTIRFELREQAQSSETGFWEHIRFSARGNFFSETVSGDEKAAKGEIEIPVAPLDFHIVSCVTPSPGFEWMDNVKVR